MMESNLFTRLASTTVWTATGRKPCVHRYWTQTWCVIQLHAALQLWHHKSGWKRMRVTWLLLDRSSLKETRWTLLNQREAFVMRMGLQSESQEFSWKIAAIWVFAPLVLWTHYA